VGFDHFSTSGCFASALALYKRMVRSLLPELTTVISPPTVISELFVYNSNGHARYLLWHSTAWSALTTMGCSMRQSSVLIQSEWKDCCGRSASSFSHFYDFAVVRYLAKRTNRHEFRDRGKVRTDFGGGQFWISRTLVRFSRWKD
jgi:hypothetical protein